MTISLLGVTKYLINPNEAKAYLAHSNRLAPVWAIDHYWKLCPEFNINLDAIVPQMFCETGYLSSPRSKPPFCNLAGIGATDDGAWGSRNESYENGVKEHIGHYWAYAGAYQNRPDLDKKAALWDDSHIVGTQETRFHFVRRVKTPHKEYLNIADFTENWASSKTYGSDIENNFLGGFLRWKKAGMPK